MAFAGRMAYAERRHDNENQEGEIHAPRDTANGNAAKVDQPDQLKDSEHKTFVEQTERLLACPCLDDLKQGPCGQRFQDAFRCFILSKEAEKGAECAYQFTQFEMCMDANHRSHLTSSADVFLIKRCSTFMKLSTSAVSRLAEPGFRGSISL
ncbi:hypothetical protein R1flu_023266 [Riccia fluitans]|uniref:CHCH domain-containing protein n=1 Tax=Riccia fluitans TaxID=41844 RepID=A0ABD1XRK3_9MARC